MHPNFNHCCLTTAVFLVQYHPQLITGYFILPPSSSVGRYESHSRQREHGVRPWWPSGCVLWDPSAKQHDIRGLIQESLLGRMTFCHKWKGVYAEERISQVFFYFKERDIVMIVRARADKHLKSLHTLNRRQHTILLDGVMTKVSLQSLNSVAFTGLLEWHTLAKWPFSYIIFYCIVHTLLTWLSTCCKLQMCSCHPGWKQNQWIV